MEILIGTDPELFVWNKNTSSFISGHDLIPGTKVMPFMVPGGGIQVDGVACEFNTLPAGDAKTFLANIKLVQSKLLEMVREKNPDLTLEATPTAFFELEYFRSLPASARALGCTPDYDAYTMEMNVPPRGRRPMRTGAGHIHSGWTYGEYTDDEEHLKKCQKVVKQLDVAIYPLSLLWDTDRRRQELYGKPGAFRPKHYGVEWRTLSNAYLRNDEIIEFVFNMSQAVTKLVFDGVLLFDEFEVVTSSQEAILDNHYKMVEKYELPEFPAYVLEKDA